MAETGANPIVSTTSTTSTAAPPRSRTVLLLAGAALALAAVAVAALFFTQQAGGNRVAVWYATLSGTEIKEGDTNGPLRVIARVPESNAAPETVVVYLGLQLIDESGQPAKYGPDQESTLLMQPSTQQDMWEHRSSMPTTPGTYHARLLIQRSSTQAEIETVDLAQARIQVKADSGAQLNSGFVFNRYGNLWIASPDAARQRRLTFFTPPNEYAADPAWSLDGKSLAFAYLPETQSDELPRTGIWSINADGSGLKQHAAPGPDETLFEPAWSPDGQTIYFSVDRMTNEPLLPGATKADTDKYRRIDSVNLATGARSQLALGAQTPANVAPDGKMLFFQDVAPASLGDNPGQQLVYGDGKSTPLVLVKPNSYPLMASPAMSPDGKWVIFSAPNGSTGEARIDFFQWLLLAPNTASAHDLPWDIFMVPASGGEITRLTTLDEDRPANVWLDNSAIAFMGEGGLYKLSLDDAGKPSGSPTMLTEGVYHGDLTWYGP